MQARVSAWLPFHARLDEYEKQAEALLEAHKLGDPEAIRLLDERHPRFLRADIPWLSKDLPDSEIRDTAITTDDAQLAIARWYDFQDWAALVEYVAAVTRENSPVFRFESAVEAVITGDS